MRAKISSKFPVSADEVWILVKKSSTLLYVTKGFLGFAGSEHFPSEWREGSTESTRLLFFGFLPAWKHDLKFHKVNNIERVLYTNEGGGLVPTWNHCIKVEPLNENTCCYTDDVEINAGVVTPLVWLYSNIFYRYRQWRWYSLLESVYGDNHNKKMH